MENPEISIGLLANNKKVIPLYFKNGPTWHTSIKLPDLLLKNHSDRLTYEIGGMLAAGLAGGRELIRLHPGRGLEEPTAQVNKTLNRLTQEPGSLWQQYNLHMLFGDVHAPAQPFAESLSLKPGAWICLRLQELIDFHYAGSDKIDDVVCELRLISDEGEITISYRIPLTSYQPHGDYIFPIRGCATIMGTAWNQVWGHRLAHSQEFALDVVDYRRDERGEFVLSSPPDSRNVADYFLFEREVLAVGDGTVVAAGDQWPNEWVNDPLDYSEERIIALTEKLLRAGMDFNHAILGNYLIIQHTAGEFSLYAHLSEGTLTVAVGDRVAQGQVIGKVGNTSNSDFPHLHFQLMDSPDFQTANGLPVMFKNLPAGQAPLCDFSETNSLLYADYLFVYT